MQKKVIHTHTHTHTSQEQEATVGAKELLMPSLSSSILVNNRLVIVCVRACARARVCACVRACVCHTEVKVSETTENVSRT